MRVSETWSDLYPGSPEKVAFYRIGKVRRDYKGVPVARRHIRNVHMQRVFAVRAIRPFNRDGGRTLHALVPLCGIDLPGFEIFAENRLVPGQRRTGAAANRQSDFYFSQIHTH